MRRLNGLTLNGLVWIKNSCSKQPTKVYCDMQGSVARGMVIENSHDIVGTNIRTIHAISSPE